MGNRENCGWIPGRLRYFSLFRPDAVEKRKILFPSLVVQPVAYPEFVSKHRNLIQNDLGNRRHGYISLKPARTTTFIRAQVILSSASFPHAQM
jgi:hypothetical protein